MKKRLFLLFLVLCLTVCAFTVSAAAEELSGRCGDNITWVFDKETSTLTLSGTGETYDYNYHMNNSQSPLSRLNEQHQILHIVVEPGITGLGEYVLCHMSNAKTLSLPDGLLSIERGALGYLRSLEELVIPDTVTTIGEGAFSACQTITSVNIPAGVKQIPAYAFSYCVALEQVTFPEGLEALDYGAFTDCALTEVHLPDSLTVLHSAFIGCSNLTTINIPPNLTTLNLSWLGITEVVIPEGVTELKGSFSNCTKLERVVLHEGVTVIGDDTFSACGALTSITLPASLKTIGSRAFMDSGLTEVEIPVGVTSIGLNAFTSCPNLEKVVIPETVQTISANCFDWSEQVAIYCKADTVAYLHAIVHDLPCEVLPEETAMVYYDVVGYKNELGDVAMVNFSLAPGRIGIIEAIPYDGCYLYDISFYDISGNLLEIQLNNHGNDLYSFVMPAQEVVIEVLFDVRYLNFRDVPYDAYYLPPVLWANHYGITTGTSPTTFSPELACTRGQVVTFLWRAAGEPEPSSANNPFYDVDLSDYFYKAVLWAVEKGITKGVSESSFAPDEPCTRGQVVTFLHRYAGTPAAASGSNPFSDVAQDYYYDAVLWAVDQQITTGTTETTFAPGDSCNRAQIVTFLYRYMN